MYLSIDEHFSYVHILALMNNAAINKRMRISLQYPMFIPFDIYPEIGLLDHTGVLLLIF